MKYLIGVFLFISSSYGQITFSLNEFEKGEFLAVKEDYSLLRPYPDVNSPIIDTIFDDFRNLSFVVLNEKPNNNFVHVKVTLSKWSNGKPDPTTGWYLLPEIITDGKEGWVLKSELLKHPVPDRLLMSCYKENNEMLLVIANNAEWHSLNSKKDYALYKGEHASAYLSIGLNYFQVDSMKEAVYYLTKSIQVLPKKRPYVLRAYAKKALGDFQGAIGDCNKGIILEANKINLANPDYSYLTENDLLYDNIDFLIIRGHCYLELKNFNSAILDFTSAIKKDNDNGELFYYRASAKYQSGLKSAACLDFSRAGELGIREAYDVIKMYCN